MAKKSLKSLTKQVEELQKQIQKEEKRIENTLGKKVIEKFNLDYDDFSSNNSINKFVEKLSMNKIDEKHNQKSSENLSEKSSLEEYQRSQFQN